MIFIRGQFSNRVGTMRAARQAYPRLAPHSMPSLALRGVALTLAGFLLLPAGCSGGAGGAGIPGLTNSVPALGSGLSYSGPRMNFLRYSHTSTVLPNGTVLVVGGSDERHLTATNLVELFDQRARVPIGETVPETIAGDFIDQDIDGNLMTLPGAGRFWHTATDMGQGRVVVVGGTSSILEFIGIANPTTLIFDPLSRTFTEPTLIVDPANDIALPRARHTAELLPNGRLLIVGGQRNTQVTVPGPFPTLQSAFPSSRTMEIFDLASLPFSPAPT